jgi:hypothetical protein
MPWLKKNLLPAVGGLVAAGLLGFAGYFLYSRIRLEKDVSEQLAGQTSELEGLVSQNPSPGNEKVDNIKTAREQEQDLQKFLVEARPKFTPVAYPTGLSGGEFKLLLDTTIDELQRAAAPAGVKLPEDYAFSFAPEKPMVAFEPQHIEPLTVMLMDIRNVCLAIFEARVLTLDGIRRPAVTPQDTPNPSGQSDFWGKKPATNDLSVSTPYEFTFHCFTAELGKVLEGLYRSPHCYIVKNIVVDQVPSTLLEKEAGQAGEMAPLPMTGMPAGMNYYQMMMMMRYRRFPRYGPAPPPMEQPGIPPPGLGPPGGMTPMVDEKPFRAVMWVEGLRLKEPKATQTAGTGGQRGQRSAPPAEPAGTTDATGQPPAGDAANPSN